MSTPGRTSEGFPVEQCRSPECLAPIVWARMPSGNMMPVDAEPSEGGTVRLEWRQGSVRGQLVNQAGQQDGQLVFNLFGPLRKSHFATCVKAKDWRTARPGKT